MTLHGGFILFALLFSIASLCYVLLVSRHLRKRSQYIKPTTVVVDSHAPTGRIKQEYTPPLHNFPRASTSAVQGRPQPKVPANRPAPPVASPAPAATAGDGYLAGLATGAMMEDMASSQAPATDTSIDTGSSLSGGGGDFGGGGSTSSFDTNSTDNGSSGSDW